MGRMYNFANNSDGFWRKLRKRDAVKESLWRNSERLKYFLKIDILISNAKYLLRLIARERHNTRKKREKYESFIIIILVYPLLAVMSIQRSHVYAKLARDGGKAIALTICDLHAQQNSRGGEMCEMEVKQFTICRRRSIRTSFCSAFPRQTANGKQTVEGMLMAQFRKQPKHPRNSNC